MGQLRRQRRHGARQDRLGSQGPRQEQRGQAWMTDDRPRIAITMLGNARDFSTIAST